MSDWEDPSVKHRLARTMSMRENLPPLPSSVSRRPTYNRQQSDKMYENIQEEDKPRHSSSLPIIMKDTSAFKAESSVHKVPSQMLNDSHDELENVASDISVGSVLSKSNSNSVSNNELSGAKYKGVSNYDPVVSKNTQNKHLYNDIGNTLNFENQRKLNTDVCAIPSNRPKPFRRSESFHRSIPGHQSLGCYDGLNRADLASRTIPRYYDRYLASGERDYASSLPRYSSFGNSGAHRGYQKYQQLSSNLSSPSSEDISLISDNSPLVKNESFTTPLKDNMDTSKQESHMLKTDTLYKSLHKRDDHEIRNIYRRDKPMSQASDKLYNNEEQTNKFSQIPTLHRIYSAASIGEKPRYSKPTDRSTFSKLFRSTSSVEDKETTESSKKKAARRISRFLRPDFYDTPREESAYVKEKEAQKAAEAEAKKQKRLARRAALQELKQTEKNNQDSVVTCTEGNKKVKSRFLRPFDRKKCQPEENNIEGSENLLPHNNHKDQKEKPKNCFLQSLEKRLEKIRGTSEERKIGKAIQALHEQNVPPTTESALLKRAVSAGDVHRVHSVLGMFRKMEQTRPQSLYVGSHSDTLFSKINDKDQYERQATYINQLKDSPLQSVLKVKSKGTERTGLSDLEAVSDILKHSDTTQRKSNLVTRDRTGSGNIDPTTADFTHKLVEKCCENNQSQANNVKSIKSKQESPKKLENDANSALTCKEDKEAGNRYTTVKRNRTESGNIDPFAVDINSSENFTENKAQKESESSKNLNKNCEVSGSPLELSSVVNKKSEPNNTDSPKRATKRSPTKGKTNKELLTHACSKKTLKQTKNSCEEISSVNASSTLQTTVKKLTGPKEKVSVNCELNGINGIKDGSSVNHSIENIAIKKNTAPTKSKNAFNVNDKSLTYMENTGDKRSKSMDGKTVKTGSFNKSTESSIFPRSPNILSNEEKEKNISAQKNNIDSISPSSCQDTSSKINLLDKSFPSVSQDFSTKQCDKRVIKEKVSQPYSNDIQKDTKEGKIKISREELFQNHNVQERQPIKEKKDEKGDHMSNQSQTPVKDMIHRGAGIENEFSKISIKESCKSSRLDKKDDIADISEEKDNQKSSPLCKTEECTIVKREEILSNTQDFKTKQETNCPNIKSNSDKDVQKRLFCRNDETCEAVFNSVEGKINNHTINLAVDANLGENNFKSIRTANGRPNSLCLSIPCNSKPFNSEKLEDDVRFKPIKHLPCASSLADDINNVVSPGDDSESFDSCSVCSDLDVQGSRNNSSLRSSPPIGDESVVDRIRRKSFYTRFNDGKSKSQRKSSVCSRGSVSPTPRKSSLSDYPVSFIPKRRSQSVIDSKDLDEHSSACSRKSPLPKFQIPSFTLNDSRCLGVNGFMGKLDETNTSKRQHSYQFRKTSPLPLSSDIRCSNDNTSDNRILSYMSGKRTLQSGDPNRGSENSKELSPANTHKNTD